MKTIQVAVGMVLDQGRFLISKRKADSHLAGFWEFPGGKIEPGEMPEQTLVRELREEVGLSVRVETAYFEQDFTYPERRVQLSFFICRLVDPAEQPLPLQVVEVRWVEKKQLADYRFPEGNNALLAKIAADSKLN